MSTDNVYKLPARAAKDAALCLELEQAGGGETGAQAVVAVGQKRGLVFTADDKLVTPSTRRTDGVDPTRSHLKDK